MENENFQFKQHCSISFFFWTWAESWNIERKHLFGCKYVLQHTRSTISRNNTHWKQVKKTFSVFKNEQNDFLQLSGTVFTFASLFSSSASWHLARPWFAIKLMSNIIRSDSNSCSFLARLMFTCVGKNYSKMTGKAKKKKRFVAETRAHCNVKSILARSATRRAFFFFFLAIWSPVFSLRSNDPDKIANRQNYYRNI